VQQVENAIGEHDFAAGTTMLVEDVVKAFA
jgi:hypothetical protein